MTDALSVQGELLTMCIAIPALVTSMNGSEAVAEVDGKLLVLASSHRLSCL